jgi:transcription elongation factor Elf1
MLVKKEGVMKKSLCPKCHKKPLVADWIVDPDDRHNYIYFDQCKACGYTTNIRSKKYREKQLVFSLD